MVVEKKVATLLLFAAIFAAIFAAVQGQGWEYCLSTPTVEVEIHVVVRGDLAKVEICDSQHFMDYLKNTIYDDFNKTSTEDCSFKLEGYTSCKPLQEGEVPRKAITFKSNLTCGGRCINHINNQTTEMEHSRQYNSIHEAMNIFTRTEHKYNQTDVIIRFFRGEKKSIFFACNGIEAAEGILCECPEECEPKEVTFSFREPEYSFVENMDNATIHIYRVSGSTDRAVTLTVSGSIQGELINQEVMFGPNDIEKAITFKILDDDIPLEPTEQFELSLNSTDRNVQFEPHGKTTINIIDDEENLCLATPRVAVNIYVVVRGDEEDDVDVCDSRHFMDALKRRIYRDFEETSGGAMCHFILDDYDFCTNIALGNKSRTAITFKTNLTCGDRCFNHTDDQTSMMEIDRQYDVINATMNINVVEILDYNQTSVVIRYFYQEEGPVVYACRDTSYVYVTQDRNLPLCDCSDECNDTVRDVSFTFRQPVYSFFENVGTATIHLDKVEGSFDETITLLVSGVIQSRTINKRITFDPTDNSKVITFFITDDEVPSEPTEEFELSLAGTQGRYNILFDPNQKTTINILDNDVSFSFGEPVYNFVENVGNATIHVDKVEGSFDQPITLSVSGVIQGELIDETITFGPNDTKIPITFEITDDVIPLEPTEVFELSLNGTDTKYNLLLEPNNKTTINIVDDDGEHDEDVCLSTPTSEITIYVVVRGKTHVEACDNQHLKHFLERTIHSDFSEISKDKCHLKPDYQISCNPLSLGDISRTEISIKVDITCGSSCIQHTYQNTSILEINRQEEIINEISILTVKKHRYSQTSDVVIRYFYGGKKPVFYSCENEEIGFIEGTNLKLCNCSDECEVPVRDVTFSFDKPVYNFIENMYNATIYVEKTSGSIDRVITLLVTGFSQGPQTVHFYQQDIRKPINFRILDNDIVLEPTKKIELLLSPTDRISLIEPHEKAIINIMDDDELLIGLTTQKVTVMEGNDVTLCVNFSSEFVTNFNIDVQYQIINISTYHPATINEDSNFSIKAITTVHGPNKLLCFIEHAIQDDFVEHEECFKIGISVPISVSDQFMVELDEGKDTTVVCIMDDDRVTIDFVDAEVQVPENIADGKKLICVNVTSGRLMREVTVMAQFQNHSADDGKDYTGEMHTLTFSQDTTLVCFMVAILDDFINEEDEFFTVSLTTTDQNVTLSQDSINIMIKDDDVVHIGFIGDPFEGREKDDTVTVTFGVLGHTELEEAVPVFVSATDIPGISNGAVSGVDYKYTSGYLNLLNEYITVDIELINDNYLEGDEDFKVLLQIVDTGRNIELFKDNAIVTIVDDDCVTIGFEENNTVILENKTLPELCLKVLEGELRRTTVINVSYRDGSTSDGEDYIITALPDTFSFSQGHTERCFSFTIRDDTEAEPEESFFITATTGDPQVKLSPSIAKVSIKDNDCPEGSIFNNCGTGCPPTCNQPTPKICSLQCVKGCFCTDNKIKHDGKCISLEECPII